MILLFACSETTEEISCGAASLFAASNRPFFRDSWTIRSSIIRIRPLGKGPALRLRPDPPPGQTGPQVGGCPVRQPCPHGPFHGDRHLYPQQSCIASDNRYLRPTGDRREDGPETGRLRLEPHRTLLVLLAGPRSLPRPDGNLFPPGRRRIPLSFNRRRTTAGPGQSTATISWRWMPNCANTRFRRSFSGSRRGPHSA